MVNVSKSVGSFIGILVILIAGLAIVPTVVTQTQDVNTTGWSFTGYEGAITLLELIPFVFIAGLVLLTVGMALYYRD